MVQITSVLKTTLFLFSLVFCAFISCNSKSTPVEKETEFATLPSVDSIKVQAETNVTDYDSTYKTIHIFVALCDNTYQGIVPVPKAIGNGQDPNNNLYWGCGYGIRTYFKKSAEWKFLKAIQSDSLVLERVIFKHASKKYYLVADAYDGQFIETCTRDFFKSTAGILKDTLSVESRNIGLNGNASLCAYIGHNGLMDFAIDDRFDNVDGKTRDVIILACLSKKYYGFYMHNAKANPLVWTTNFMAPEAYTIHDAISGYVKGETNEQIRSRAAAAYSRFQKCSVKAARGLLVTGF